LGKNILDNSIGIDNDGLLRGSLISLAVEQYDPFEHLRQALFWEQDQPICMLTFYADDANKTDQHDYIHIAAYIGLVEQWNQFSIDWRLRLAKAGLTWFHANEFFNGAGEFATWNLKQREGERTILLQDLTEIIGRARLFSFICVVHVPSWQKLNKEYCLEERCLRPYPLAGRTIIRLAQNWWRARGHDWKDINYIFDRGFEDWGMLADRVEDDLGIILHKEDSRTIRPLQAADWLAYESGKEAPQYDNWDNRKRQPRMSLRALLSLGSQPTIFREKNLRKLCEHPRVGVSTRDVSTSK
jgi:hypothetical protein